jgi:hypothetical protein
MAKEIMIPVYISRKRLGDESGNYRWISQYIAEERDKLKPDFWLPISEAKEMFSGLGIRGICFFDMQGHDEVEFYISGNDEIAEAKEFLIKLAIEVSLREEVLK